MGIFSKLFGDAGKRSLNEFNTLVDNINKLEPKFESFSLEEIKNKTQEFKKRLTEKETLDDILPESFALVREASKRTLQLRHFDVQLIGGVVLHQGKIAEMSTGEGKTLASTLPAYLNALSGNGVHVVTVNDYLSMRDVVWMGQIYHTLGLSAACIVHDASYIYDPDYKKESTDQEELDEIRDTQGSFKIVHEFLRPVSRQEAYAADITYGTNNEFGFDYLRDNMVQTKDEMRQKLGHNFVIIDEVDSILIDEARTPLIISAPDTDSDKLYRIFAGVVPQLKAEDDYVVDEKLKAVSLLENGIEKVEKSLGIGNIYEEKGVRYVHHLHQALRAKVLFQRDKDYVVRNGEVVIVDEFTGRMMPGRRWSDGLHQAVEAKEGVQIQKESRTLATITFQNFFRLYSKLSGMTGTAATSAEEFDKVYGLDVVVVPTNKPKIRIDSQDRIYKNQAAKYRAVIEEVKKRHEKGQPVLIGTVSIEKNELLSAMLSREGIPHKLLNAKNHESEAQIISQAGKVGAVTVATNMAGRGVDIVLGGNPFIAEESRKVEEAGGLHVMGTARHEARRIDNQLRGRSGRQGNPGSSQFFVAADDELVRVFSGDKIKNLMERFGLPEDQPIENKFISRAIEQAQSKIEGHNFDARKHVLDFDDVMNKHRAAVYELRREILDSEVFEDRILDYLYDAADNLVGGSMSPEGDLDEENLRKMLQSLLVTENKFEFESKDPVKIKEQVKVVIDSLYDERATKIGKDTTERLNKLILLRTIDELWMDHLIQMESLKESVGLRAYGQRDPLVEYKIESQKLFDGLLDNVKFQVANILFRVGEIKTPQARATVTNEQSNSASSSSTTVAQSPTPSNKKVGRNEPCPCGSGKKYKKCHGQ